MPVKLDILATLSYFDLFDYPLTQGEIFQYLRQAHTHEELNEGLHQLTSENWVFKFDEFYTLQENFGLINRRRAGNQKARQMLGTANRIASFLSAFPFVRGVAVSGSLSKNFADENSDIDFFIITVKNKLWLARSLMHVFKKITFLFNRQDWFCMNYFVDESALQIKEKNIYTAIEVATLLPLRGIKCFEDFFNNNIWSRDYLPNHSLRISYVKETRSPWIKKIIEFLFSNPLGNLLDRVLMKITAERWLDKTRNLKTNKRGEILGMDVSRHYAKPNPRNFQEKLVGSYEKKIINLLRNFETRAKSIY